MDPRLAPPVPPSRRALPALLVLFFLVPALLSGGLWEALQGGSTLPSTPSTAAPPFPAYEEVPSAYDAATGEVVWVFPDLATWTYAHGSWTNITATAGTPYDMGQNAEMAYDTATQQVVLYGGLREVSDEFDEGGVADQQVEYGPYPLSDTWVWAGGSWENVTASLTQSPPARWIGAMTYDSTDAEVVLFGGSLVYSTGTYDRNDTWTYSSGTWTNVSGPGPPPVQGSDDHAWVSVGFADDPQLGGALLYLSQEACDEFCLSTWVFRGGVWTDLLPVGGASPYLTFPEVFTYDSTSQQIFVQSSCASETFYSCPVSYGTFTFTGDQWTSLPSTSGLPLWSSESFANDPTDGGVLVVGGCCWSDFTEVAVPTQDSWVFAHGGWSASRPWGGGPPQVEDQDGLWLALALVAMPTATWVFAGSRGVAIGGTFSRGPRGNP